MQPTAAGAAAPPVSSAERPRLQVALDFNVL